MDASPTAAPTAARPFAARVVDALAGLARRRPALVAMLVALALFLPGLDSLPVTDRDEALFAQTSRQMVETGDWIDPRFQDEPRYKKPIGIYWLQAAAARFGPYDPASIAAYRLPSLAGAVAAVGLTAAIGTTLAGPAVGAVAAIVFAGTVGIGIEARLAKTDAVLAATVLAALLVVARAWMARGTVLPLRDVLLFWCAIAAGVLVKGPPILVVVGATLATLAVVHRSLALLRALRPVIGLPLALALVLPWLVAIGIVSDGAFFEEALGRDFAAKIAAGQESHGAPPGAHLVMQIGLFWPAVAFAPAAIVHGWRRRQDPAVVFLAAWLIPSFLLLELVPTKLPNYVLPLMPALAIAIALAAAAPVGRPRWWHLARVHAPAGAILLLAAVVAAPLALDAVPDGATVALAVAVAVLLAIAVRRWDGRPADIRPASPAPPSARPPVFGAPVFTAPVFAAPVFGALAEASGSRRLVVVALAGGLLVAAVIARAVPGVPEVWVSDRIAAAVHDRAACRFGPVALVGYREPSVVFRLGTGTRVVPRPAVGDPASYRGACAVVVDDRLLAAAGPALSSAGFSARSDVILRGRNLNGFRLRRLVLFEAGG